MCSKDKTQTKISSDFVVECHAIQSDFYLNKLNGKQTDDMSESVLQFHMIGVDRSR